MGGFRRSQFLHHDQAWVTFSASQASEPFHLVVSERPRSVLWQPGARWPLVAVACPVMFAGVLEGLGIEVRFLQPLAPQRSVREALSAPGVPCFDAWRVLLTVGTLIFHTYLFNEWRHEQTWTRLFHVVNVSFTTLSVFLSLRERKRVPFGRRYFMRHFVSRFLKMAPLLWFGVYLRSVMPLRNPRLHRDRCFQPLTLLPSLFLVHEVVFLTGTPCGIMSVFESLLHVELCMWTLVSMLGGWLGICALIFWPCSVFLDAVDTQYHGRFHAQMISHGFAELLPSALATVAVHCGLRGRVKSRRSWLWGACVCFFTTSILVHCEDTFVPPVVRWRKADSEVTTHRCILLRLWLQTVNLPHIVALVIIFNIFDDGAVSQKVGALRPFLALCSRLSPAVMALHTIFYELVNDYGRLFFDGSVFSFVGEIIANVICCFLLACPVYFLIQVPAQVLAGNFKLLLCRAEPRSFPFHWTQTA